MEIEEYRTVTGFEDYEVSNLGNVKSKARARISPRKNGPARLNYPEKILKQDIDVGGYPRVTLYKEGKVKHKKVHQLVAQEFIGPCPEGMEVCHRKNDKLNIERQI